jgi:hypothetical protein
MVSKQPSETICMTMKSLVFNLDLRILVQLDIHEYVQVETTPRDAVSSCILLVVIQHVSTL